MLTNRFDEHTDSALAEFLNRQGRQIRREGDLERADRYYSAALSLAPYSTLAQYNKTMLLFERGELDTALAGFRGIANSNPDSSLAADCMLRIGDIFEKQGKKQAAYEMYKKVLDATIGNLNYPEEADAIIGDAYNRMGCLEEKNGKLDKAEELFRSAIRCNNQDEIAISNLAECLTAKGHHSEALSMWKRAIDVEPEDGTLMLGIAHCYLSLSNPIEARKWAQKALLNGKEEANDILATIS